MSKNRLKGLPHFPGALEQHIGRDKFLNGKLTTYFAPGHLPSIIGTPYINPKDWIKPTYILRMPQIVWLEVRFKWAQNIGFFDYLDTGPTDSTTIYDFEADPSFSGLIGNVYGTNTEEAENFYVMDYDTQPNAALIEKHRLIPIFKNVKEKIEKLRKGKTWVEVINWFDDDDLILGGTDNTGDIEKNWNPVNIFDPSIWLLCPGHFLEFPDAVSPRLEYLGTNFLNIYCGDYLSMGEVEAGFVAGSDVESDILEESSSFQNIFQRMRQNYNKFYGHTTMLFHPNLGWGSWEGITNDRVEWAPGHFAGRGWMPESAGDNAGHDAWISSAIDDATSTGLNEYSGQYFDAAVRLGIQNKDDKTGKPLPIDIQHPGDTSIVNEDYLVNLIAKHFNFNPVTGKDLAI